MQVTLRRPPATMLAAQVSADGEIVAAVAGKRILIWGLLLTGETEGTIALMGGAVPWTGDLTTTGLYLAKPGPVADEGTKFYPHYETGVNEAFSIAASGTLTGTVWYELVAA